MKCDIFDFDGTLIKGDSIKLFAKWISKSYLEFLILFYGFHFLYIDSKTKKFKRAKFFSFLMKKRKKNIKNFFEILNNHLFDDSLFLINNSKNLKIIISASFFEIIGEYCRDILKVNLISNSYDDTDDINYINKVIALKKRFGNKVEIINAYGNSMGDFDILRLAKNSFYRKKNGVLVLWEE